MVFAFILAFYTVGWQQLIKWIGLGNFIELFHDTFFKAALKNTIIYCIGTVPLTMIASLGLADCAKSEGNMQRCVPNHFPFSLMSLHW